MSAQSRPQVVTRSVETLLAATTANAWLAIVSTQTTTHAMVRKNSTHQASTCVKIFNADINECVTGNGGCDQNCHNSIGSYNCSCNIGYLLDEDDHGCSGNAKALHVRCMCDH